MTPQTTDMQAVVERLEKLERQYRGLKKLGMVALAALGGLLLMAQSSAKRTVEANEFVLKDANGKMRGRFFVMDDGAPALAFLGREDDVKVLLTLKKGEPTLNFYGNAIRSSISPTALAFFEKAGNQEQLRSALSALRGEPKLFLLDREGFNTVVGNTALDTPQTGESHTTSAASLVMFDRGGKVIWRAP